MNLMTSRVFLLSFVLLLANSSHAFGEVSDLEITKFMKNCLKENESFTKERIGPTNIYLISIGKFESGLGTTYTVQDMVMVKASETNSSDITLINNTAEIAGTLTDKFAAMNLTSDSLYPTTFEIGEILAMLMRFNESREPNEGKCKLWIGTDTPEFDCKDRESCFRACHTPLSNPVASGVGWPFVDAVWMFMNNTRNMDSNLSKAFRNMDDIESKAGDAEVLFNDLDKNLANIQNASNEISNNPLFDTWRYSFCWPIKYNRTSLITAKILAKRLHDRMDVVLSIPKQAHSISKAGIERAGICRANFEKANKPKTRVTFWGKMDQGERNFLILLSAGVSPGPIFPAYARDERFDRG